METTKAALEHDRKIQQLQMQAIHALWKKVSQMGPSSNMSITEGSGSSTNINTHNPSTKSDNIDLDAAGGNSTAIVQDLAKTCTMLTNQVQQLQGSMRDVLNCITLFCNISQSKTHELVESEKQEQSSNNQQTFTKDIEKCDSCSTQTEIIAVNTPQIENLPFPFMHRQPSRPSTLPLGTTIESSKMSNSDVIVENVEEIKSASPMLSADDSNLLDN